MLKKLFVAIVSVAMLFCMSTSAMSVQAEDPVTITIEGAENDTIDLYFRENSNIETVRGRRFLLEPHEEFDELEFSVIDGEEFLSIPWIYKLDGDKWNGQVWFSFLSEGTAVVQASIGDTVIRTFTVNTHLGKYVNRFETRESNLNVLVGEELNLRDYVLSMAYPAGADYSDEEFTYRIDYDPFNCVEISGDILKCTESCQVCVFVKSKADAEHSISLAGISAPISSIGFNQDNYSRKFVEDSEENIVLAYPTTTPDNAIVGLPVEEVQISISDTSIAEIGDIGEPLYRIPVRFKKPGSVELTIKYNDFTATTVVKCYLEKAPETIIAPDSVKGYKGYTNRFYVDFGPDQEVNKDVIFEVIEGEDIVSLSKSKDNTGRAAGSGNIGHYCYYDGIGIGKAVIRAKSVVNENVYKDVAVEITDDPAPKPRLWAIRTNGEEREDAININNTFTVKKNDEIQLYLTADAIPVGGSVADFINITALTKQIEESEILDLGIYLDGGNQSFQVCQVIYVLGLGSETLDILPGESHTIDVVDYTPRYVFIKQTKYGDLLIDGKKLEDEHHVYEKGSTLKLSANPKPGYHFSHWVINGQENKTSNDINGALEITVDEDTTIAAVFTPCDDQELRGEIKSTCTVSGYSGDVYCKRHNALIKQGETLPMTDHNYVDHICTECLEAEEGYTAFLYEDENGIMHAEVNTVVGFADVKDEYSLIVGSPVTISQELKYEKDPSGKYMLGFGSDPEIEDETIAKAVIDYDTNIVTVTPIKAGTTVLILDLMGYKKEITIKVQNTPVTFTVKENPQGAVIVNGVEMKDGANTVESGIRTNMFTIPNPGYHFDYWIIDGEKTEGVFGSNGGLRFYPEKDMDIQAVFTPCDDEEVRNAVKPTCTKTGYSGDVYCKTNNVLIKKGEVLPMTEHNYVDHICKECGAKEDVPEEKPEAPVTETIKEGVVIDVSDAIPEEVTETIKETISDVKAENVVESIPEAVKTEIIKELLKDIDTTDKEVQIKVVNTVKVTAADLKSENKSITYEISPKAVVTVDGVEVKTADLKNDQLSGGKDITITLPINGLDLKEIVHKSEGYDPEYIYEFVISREGTVTFKISHFSSFTLNEDITKPAESSTGKKPVVDTGDHTEVMLYGGIGIIALIGALAVILFRRKHA